MIKKNRKIEKHKWKVHFGTERLDGQSECTRRETTTGCNQFGPTHLYQTPPFYLSTVAVCIFGLGTLESWECCLIRNNQTQPRYTTSHSRDVADHHHHHPPQKLPNNERRKKEERKKEIKICFVFWDFVGFFQTTQNKRETNERNPIPIFCYFYLFFFFSKSRGVESSLFRSTS